MAVPKKRTTSSRQGARRSHDALKAPQYNKCPNCGKPILTHRACSHCGKYDGKQVLKI